MRVKKIELTDLKKPGESKNEGTAENENKPNLEPLKTCWGSYVNLELGDAALEVDFTIRRHRIPSDVSVSLLYTFDFLQLSRGLLTNISGPVETCAPCALPIAT